MLFKIFAKESFDQIDKELNELFQSIGLSQLKIRKQVATYSKPYNYIVEGSYEGYRFVLSLHSSELKEKENKQQLEFIIHCENPNWIAMQLYEKGQHLEEKKTLGMEVVDNLPLLDAQNIVVETNRKDLILSMFDTHFCQQILNLAQPGFLDFNVERKRLYYKTAWLPDSLDKKESLTQAMRLGVALVKQIDN